MGEKERERERERKKERKREIVRKNIRCDVSLIMHYESKCMTIKYYEN